MLNYFNVDKSSSSKYYIFNEKVFWFLFVVNNYRSGPGQSGMVIVAGY